MQPSKGVRRKSETNLFENLGSHLVTAVKDNTEFPASLHFFEKGSGVLRVKGELTDL